MGETLNLSIASPSIFTLRQLNRSSDKLSMTDQLSQLQAANGRYRTLLELTTAIDKETNVQVVLKSLHKLLSAVIRFDSVAMLLLTNDGKSLRVVAVERGSAGPHITLGAEEPYAGTEAARAVEEQRAIYIPDIRLMMAKLPETAVQAGTTELRSAYMVPISTPRRKLGALCFGRREEGALEADEIALMEAVASHVGTALESALESDAAESYQRQLLAERDRWKLLLEINNHVISRLDVKELFRAACDSFRKYFENDLAAIWLLHRDQNRLEVAVMDFPASKRFLQDVELLRLTAEQIQWV